MVLLRESGMTQPAIAAAMGRVAEYGEPRAHGSTPQNFRVRIDLKPQCYIDPPKIGGIMGIIPT